MCKRWPCRDYGWIGKSDRRQRFPPIETHHQIQRFLTGIVVLVALSAGRLGVAATPANGSSWRWRQSIPQGLCPTLRASRGRRGNYMLSSAVPWHLVYGGILSCGVKRDKCAVFLGDSICRDEERAPVRRPSCLYGDLYGVWQRLTGDDGQLPFVTSRIAPYRVG